MEKTVIVLAMHGAPPNDFPRDQIMELFGLHSRLEYIDGPERAALEERYNELDARVRAWPRNPTNDPFYTGSLELANHLEQASAHEVFLGFNEFCAPSLDEALDQAIEANAKKVFVVTPMMTRGGEHSEKDIPTAIQRARERHPGVEVVYVWPFDVSQVAEFLVDQISKAG